jgi:hypothetical protein
MLMIDEVKTYQSKNWDINISLKELIDSNLSCYIDRSYYKLNSHHDSGAYNGICIYLKYPNTDKYSLKIGIAEDGFVYIADSTPNINECEKSWTLSAIAEMYYYGHYLKWKKDGINSSWIIDSMKINMPV